MKFFIEDERVVEDLNKSTGEIYRNQWAQFEQDGQRFPFKFGIGKSAPLTKGEYQLSPRSFGTNDYHKLKLNFVSLEPVKLEALKKVG